MQSLIEKSNKIIEIIGDRSYVSFEELMRSTGMAESQLIQVKITLEECLKKEDKKNTVTILNIALNQKGFLIE